MNTASDIMAVVALALNPALVIVLGYMLKKWIERLEATIKDILTTQGACQIALAKTYRTKSEAEADSDRQWAKLDDLGNRMVKAETRLDAGAR